MNGFGDNFVEATLAIAASSDTDVDWRPRVPQWPAIGDTMATAIQSALSARTPSRKRSTTRSARRTDDAGLTW